MENKINKADDTPNSDNKIFVECILLFLIILGGFKLIEEDKTYDCLEIHEQTFHDKTIATTKIKTVAIYCKNCSPFKLKDDCTVEPDESLVLDFISKTRDRLRNVSKKDVLFPFGGQEFRNKIIDMFDHLELEITDKEENK